MRLRTASTASRIHGNDDLAWIAESNSALHATSTLTQLLEVTANTRMNASRKHSQQTKPQHSNRPQRTHCDKHTSQTHMPILLNRGKLHVFTCSVKSKAGPPSAKSTARFGWAALHHHKESSLRTVQIHQSARHVRTCKQLSQQHMRRKNVSNR